jgi:hypothetical protein
MSGHGRTVLNRQLAELLGWTLIEQAGQSLIGTPPWWAGNSRGQAGIPDWEADWSVCAPLMVKYQCYPFHACFFGQPIFTVRSATGHTGPTRRVYVPADEYPGLEHAARAAIMQAVIVVLATQQGWPDAAILDFLKRK